jgi:hypothetical protein
MPSAEDIKSTINTIVDKAESEGKLAPLAALISEMKLQTTPKALFLAAQTRDEMRGKTPDELASMLRAKPTVINIILSTDTEGEGEEPEGEGPAETAAEGGVEEPTGEAAVKEKMKKMKKSAMAMDQEEEDMADEEAAKAYKSKLMM